MNIVQRAAGAVVRTIQRAYPALYQVNPTTSWGWGGMSSWLYPSVQESYPGAWQNNDTVERQHVSAYWAVFSCTTLIAGDIAKLPAVVMQRDRAKGIFIPTMMRPVLMKPNHYQTRLEFFFMWVMSLLLYGNTYVLKQRNEQGFIVALYILDPCRVCPMVTPDGDVWYNVSPDSLSGVEESVYVPQSEIIHDKMYTLWHPLIGVSPIYACGQAAIQGLTIQSNSQKFFGNMSRPSGVLSIPGSIAQADATTLRDRWEANFAGNKVGRVAVLADGVKYEPMTSVSAEDSQLIEQLKMTGEMVAACYHVPGYKIGVGPMPTVNNTGTLNQQYYDQCLQYIIEKIEQSLDKGLEIEPPFETWFDLEVLMRMDPFTRYDSYTKAIQGGWMMPNEARRKEDMEGKKGGEALYMQVQNSSLEALQYRDTQSMIPPEEGGTNIQDAVMNGAQIAQLTATLTQVATGQLPPASAAAALSAAFPLLTAAQIDAMLAPLEGFTPKPTEPPPAPPSDDEPPEDEGEEEDEPPPDDEPPEDDADDDDEEAGEMAFMATVLKGLPLKEVRANG